MGRPRKKPEDWHSKVHPELLELLKGYRDTVRSWEGSDKTPETKNRLSQQMQEELQRKLPETLKVERQSPDEVIYPLSSAMMDAVPQEVVLEVARVEKLHWFRYREPFLVAYRKYQAGSLEASEKIHSTLADYDRMRLGGKQPKKVRTNEDHDVIFSSAWGHGLENLGEEELAECFNEFCPCGQPDHDGHALRMLRDRMFRSLVTAYEKRPVSPIRKMT